MFNPLEIPEIRYYIGAFLEMGDLINCACVSQQWYSTFTTFIWRHVILGGTTAKSLPRPLPTIEQIQSRSVIIRTLTFKDIMPNAYYQLQNLHNLRSIEYYIGSIHPLPLSNLIRNHSSTLRHLHIFGGGFSFTSRTFDAIMLCRNLASLCLSSHIMTMKELENLLTACINIEKATNRHLDNIHDSTVSRSSFGGLFKLYLNELSLYNDSTLSTLAPLINMQHVYIQNISGVGSTFNLKLLALFPNIKELVWKGDLTWIQFPMDDWAEFIESRALKHLTSLELLGSGVHDGGLSRTIKALPSSLTKLSVVATGFGPEAFDALISAERHYNYIQELDLFECLNVTSSMIQRILMTMPALKQFSAGRILASDMLGASSSSPDGDSNGGDWICKNLRILRLCIDMGPTTDRRSVEYKNRQRRVHQQISKLQLLETLDVSRCPVGRVQTRAIRPLDHKLDTGLGFLVSLKRLRHFYFRAGQPMTTKEVDWMTNNWRSLTAISLIANPGQRINGDLVERLAQHGVSVE